MTGTSLSVSSNQRDLIAGVTRRLGRHGSNQLVDSFLVGGPKLFCYVGIVDLMSAKFFFRDW